MHRVFFFLVLALAVSILPACHTPKAPPPSATMSEQIAGDWFLASLNGQPVPPPPAKTNRVPSLSITRDGAVSGFAGVNRFAGTTDPRAFNDGKITLDRLAATKMAGPEAANRFESGFLWALASSKSFRVRGQRLELLDDAGTLVAGFTRR